MDAQGTKIFEGDYLGTFGEDDEGQECMGTIGVVTWWESDARYVLTEKSGLANDWTYEEEAQPENWGNLYELGNIHDEVDFEEEEE